MMFKRSNPLNAGNVTDFCRRWKITDLSVFGSVVRHDFGPRSGVDVLVTYAEDANWSLLDQIQMEQELAKLAGRPVDLIERQVVEQSKNDIRRRAILESAKQVYVAR